MSTKPTDYIVRRERSVTPPPAPTHDDIASLAHALWEGRGRGDGRAEEDWLEAERMLTELYLEARTNLTDHFTW